MGFCNVFWGGFDFTKFFWRIGFYSVSLEELTFTRCFWRIAFCKAFLEDWILRCFLGGLRFTGLFWGDCCFTKAF